MGVYASVQITVAVVNAHLNETASLLHTLTAQTTSTGIGGDPVHVLDMGK